MNDVTPIVNDVSEPLTAAEKRAAHVARISIVRSFEGAAVARFARERARRREPIPCSYRCGDVRWTTAPRPPRPDSGGVS